MGATDTLVAWGHAPQSPWLTAMVVYAAVVVTCVVLWYAWRGSRG
jgi:hypothetical protein